MRGGLRGPLTQGLGAVLKPAAFRGLLCSGPPRGRNITFVAPRAWLPDAGWDVDTEVAVDALAPPNRTGAGTWDDRDAGPQVTPFAPLPSAVLPRLTAAVSTPHRSGG